MKIELHSTVLYIWNFESQQSQRGSTTTRFFPTFDAHSIKSRSLLSHLPQILTRHNLLNDHQYRLKFVLHWSAPVGVSLKIQIIFFFVRLFTSQRKNFTRVCLSLTGTWPPPLSSLSSSPILLASMCSFISKKKRLNSQQRLYNYSSPPPSR